MLGKRVGTSRRLRYGALVVSLELFFGGWNGALAQSSAGAEGGAAQNSPASEAPKSLPEGSVFFSLQQSFKEDPRSARGARPFRPRGAASCAAILLPRKHQKLVTAKQTPCGVT